MRSNQKILIWILVSLFLFITPKLTNYSISNNDHGNETELETSKISGKIYISGNSDWILLKNDGTCTGTGTPSDPYVIKDLEINGGGSGDCIYIRYSNVYFKIENCTLYNSGGAFSNAAIKLIDSVSNGQVINNTIYSSLNGIYIWDSNNLIISRNKLFLNDETGIYMTSCHDNLISENYISSNRQGINLISSSSNNILENEIRYSFVEGLRLSGESDNNIISRNIFDHDEIKIYSCSRNVIRWNTIANANIGIYIDAYSLCNEVSNNIFNGNGQDIQDLQAFCPDLLPDLANLVIIGLIIVISSVLIIGIIISRKGSSKRKITLEVKPMELQEKEIIFQEQVPIKKEKLKEVEVISFEELSQKEEEIIEANLTQLEELPIEREIKESEENVRILEEIPIKEEIKEVVIPTHERRLIDEIPIVNDKPDKQQIIEETGLGNEEPPEKETFMPKEVEIKEKVMVNEAENVKEEITEKIKIALPSNLICQYCGFNNEIDANYCVQCGQGIQKK